MRTPNVFGLDFDGTGTAAAFCDVTGAQPASTRRFDRGPDAATALDAAAAAPGAARPDLPHLPVAAYPSDAPPFGACALGDAANRTELSTTSV